MLNVVELCFAANNILFSCKGNHARRYSLNKKLCDKWKKKQRIEKARSNHSENEIRKYVATVSETAVFLKEGPEGIKWELALAGFCPGKMGFKPQGLGFGRWEWE